MGDFANVFKELRKRKDLTQEKLAEALGISKSSVNMYERGERRPDFETLEIIADFFNVDMNYLLGKESSASSPYSEDVEEYLEYLHKRPEMKMLFSASKNVTKEQLEQVVKMIESFKPKYDDEGC